MTNPQKPTLLGMTELAELYGVSRQTATGWRRQTDFPKPIADLAMGPVWDLEDLKAWRMPPHSRPDYGRRSTFGCAWCDSKVIDGQSLQVIPADFGIIEAQYDCNHCGETTTILLIPSSSGLVAKTWRKESK